MPKALIKAGLLQGMSLAAHVGLPEPTYGFEIDPIHGVRNFPAIVDFTRRIEAEVSFALKAGQVPVLLGGDCSVLLGPALALKHRGRYALVHVDAHDDFGHEGNFGKPYPSIAGADLAVVTGRGLAALTDLDGLRPYFHDEDVIQLGEHAEAESSDYQTKDFPKTAIRRFPLQIVKREGIVEVLSQILNLLTLGNTSGFWVHLDVDVIDAALLPAVDSPESPGFTWEELDVTLCLLLSHPKFVGMNIGIFDPELDPTADYARKLAELLRTRLKVLSNGISKRE